MALTLPFERPPHGQKFPYGLDPHRIVCARPTAGSANAQTIDPDDGFGNYRDGDTFEIVAGFTTTAAATLQIVAPVLATLAEAFTALPLKYADGRDATLIAGHRYWVTISGGKTNWLVSPVGAAPPSDKTFLERSSGITVTPLTGGDWTVSYSSSNKVWWRRNGWNIEVKADIIFTPTFTTASGQITFGNFPAASVDINNIGLLDVASISDKFTWPSGYSEPQIIFNTGLNTAKLTFQKSLANTANLAVDNLTSGQQHVLRVVGVYPAD